ncbi:MAG TPA: amidohydrolase family protein [Candidatus Limnocylindria bacterium]|nr:amidohydrolase family protein [Candidatus Limnocylindria bacterium]
MIGRGIAVVLATAVAASCAPAPAAVATPSASASVATVAPSPSPSASATPSPSAASGLLPIFDAHLHYSAPAWSVYPPAAIAKLLDSLGVRAALVSSAPDEGTFRLRAVMGDRVVPMLGPYRNAADVFSWARDPSIVPYVESIYRRGEHRGFGEFHLLPGQIGLPAVRGVLALAARERLFLQAHADARAIVELLDHAPDTTVLWAHAGVDATPEQIAQLLDRWPKLWVELSLRDDVAPNGRLDPRWRDLLLRHSGRFMVGTDTWTAGGTFTGNERWDTYGDIVARIRAWLGQLPPDAAEAIAYRNAERFLAQLPR